MSLAISTENMDHNRITTYSLLAHINNSDAGMRDFSDVFLPLVKSSIARLSNRGITKGASLMEIKKEVDIVYQLDMPLPLVRKLVNKIADNENLKEAQFVLYADGAFSIKDFTFADYSELLNKQESELEALNDAYYSFLQLKGVEPSSQISIFDFLDQNRASLAQYFASDDKKYAFDSITKERHAHQADFIISIKSIHNHYNVLKKVYLGSIIAGYLEIKVEDIKHEVEFVLDTNFVTGLLDLSLESSHHTCEKIIEICRRLKYKVTILDITLRETKGLIEGVAESLQSSFLQRRLDPESIANACERRKLTKTDLQAIGNNLQNLLMDLGVNVIPHTTVYENEAKQSKEYAHFMQFRNTSFSALHDATGVIYVKKKRGKAVTNFYSANCWFVTNTPHQQNNNSKSGLISEIIRAEDLVNILWLSSPSIPNVEMLEVGLTRLISSAYSDSLPSARVLKELDFNIRKYADGKIQPRELHRVASAIANKTLINLDQINELAKSSEAEFIAKLKDIAAEVEAEELEKKTRADEFLKYNQQIADQRVADRENELKEKYKKDLEEAAANSLGQHAKELSRQNLEYKIDKLEECNRILIAHERVKSKCIEQADRLTEQVFWIIFALGLVLVGALAYYLYQRKDIERIGVVLGLIMPFMASLWIFLTTNLIKSIGLESVRDKSHRYFLSQSYDQYDYNEKEYNEMRQKKTLIESDIKKLSTDLE